MKKAVKCMLIAICVFLSIMIIVATILRFISTNTIGVGFFELSSITGAISLFGIIGGYILDAALIIVTIIVCKKSKA